MGCSGFSRAAVIVRELIGDQRRSYEKWDRDVSDTHVNDLRRARTEF